MGGGNRLEGAHQQRIVLAWFDRADGQDVPGAPVGQPQRHPPAWLRARVEAGDPRVHHPDPRRVHGELGDHLVGHEPRRGVHPRPFGHRPPDEGGELEGGRFAELGVEHHGEVVDGHHPGGPSGRWNDVVGAVDHVVGPDEPFDGGPRGPPPRRVQGPRRHGPLAGGDTLGDQRLDATSTSPAHREGRHIEVREGGQARQRAVAELADTGRSTKQRCGVDSDRQPARFGGCRSLRGHQASLAHRR